MRSIRRCLLPVLLISIAPSMAAAQSDETPSAAPTSVVAPVVRVTSIVGRPTVSTGEGAAPSPLGMDATIAAGSTITTGPEDRVALAVARRPDVTESQTDMILVGPGSVLGVKFEQVGTVAPHDAPPPILIDVRRGVARGAVRHPSGHGAFSFTTAGHRVDLQSQLGRTRDLGSVVVAVSPGTCTYEVLSGSATLNVGKRKIRVLKNQRRVIEGDRVLASRSITGEECDSARDRCAMPGVTLPGDPVPVVAQPVPPGLGLGVSVAPDPADVAAAGYAYVKMTTSMGDIWLELDTPKAPISVENFLGYVRSGHYDGTIFHRVMKNFMIQGGGFDETMTQKQTRDPIKNEWDNGLRNSRGTIAMARTSAPDSATAQFFINVVNNPGLSQPRGGAAYAVFGKVVKGMDVVDEIREVSVRPIPGTPHQHVPVTPVVIQKAEIMESGPPA